MNDETQVTGTTNLTASDLRRRTKSSNRMVLWLLLGVAGFFLAAAFGVAMLVIYGPF
ncbi:hypothetical protein ABIE58_002729 [Roseovarius sp. MBR-78]|jgi:hypothetical protein|uniref:hypothetical protein n=1 Tax=Roseovarius sp. MBR-78 TaxID=3156460 RepID=UPI003398AB38